MTPHADLRSADAESPRQLPKGAEIRADTDNPEGVVPAPPEGGSAIWGIALDCYDSVGVGAEGSPRRGLGSLLQKGGSAMAGRNLEFEQVGDYEEEVTYKTLSGAKGLAMVNLLQAGTDGPILVNVGRRGHSVAFAPSVWRELVAFISEACDQAEEMAPEENEDDIAEALASADDDLKADLMAFLKERQAPKARRSRTSSPKKSEAPEA